MDGWSVEWSKDQMIAVAIRSSGLLYDPTYLGISYYFARHLFTIAVSIETLQIKHGLGPKF